MPEAPHSTFAVDPELPDIVDIIKLQLKEPPLRFGTDIAHRDPLQPRR